jgi:hypothetical protein
MAARTVALSHRRPVKSCSNALQAVALVDVQHSHIRRWWRNACRRRTARGIALILSGWRVRLGRTGVAATRPPGRPASARPAAPWAWRQCSWPAILADALGGRKPAHNPRRSGRMELRDRCITELRLRPCVAELEGWTRGSAVAMLD